MRRRAGGGRRLRTDTTVESSIYCRPDVVGRGIGTALYSALFDSLAGEDIHQIVAGISQPNAASVALHQRCGFRPVGIFSRSAGSSASIGMWPGSRPLKG